MDVSSLPAWCNHAQDFKALLGLSVAISTAEFFLGKIGGFHKAIGDSVVSDLESSINMLGAESGAESALKGHAWLKGKISALDDVCAAHKDDIHVSTSVAGLGSVVLLFCVSFFPYQSVPFFVSVPILGVIVGCHVVPFVWARYKTRKQAESIKAEFSTIQGFLAVNDGEKSVDDSTQRVVGAIRRQRK